MKEIRTWEEIVEIRKKLRNENKKVVFTNGVFDILHSGHVDYLTKSKALGDILIVGLNSDKSVKSIKGDKRPIITQENRAIILASLKPVDFVVLFDEDTPAKLIDAIIPDILVKGADWNLDKIEGRETVIKNGGTVKNIKFVNEQSTSKIIQKILSLYEKNKI
ncbi:MAG: D-glycero-beta-D-manno-heptose 1-phosphate adenylyltransferase [Ignavibacteriaceae bacterium]|jgi:rfaE bifunctional protein nucleotidyltransferase chain/domain